MGLDDLERREKQGLIICSAIVVSLGLAAFTSFSLTEAVIFELVPVLLFVLGDVGDAAGTVLTSGNVVPAFATGMGVDIITGLAAVGGLAGNQTLGALVGVLAIGSAAAGRARRRT